MRLCDNRPAKRDPPLDITGVWKRFLTETKSMFASGSKHSSASDEKLQNLFFHHNGLLLYSFSHVGLA